MKPDINAQIYVHAIIAVKYRHSLILPFWKEQLNSYITATVQAIGHRVLEINSVPDHLHLFMGMRPSQSVSDLVRLVKEESSEWVNDRNFCERSFDWQNGFGAFSHGRTDVTSVKEYIRNQEFHHTRESFKDEYARLLREFDVDYDSGGLFPDPV